MSNNATDKNPPPPYLGGADDTIHDPAFKTVGNATVNAPVMTSRQVNVYYGDKQAIYDVCLDLSLIHI